MDANWGIGDCYTEDKLCCGSCKKKLAGKMGDNVIEFIPGVTIESDCKSRCKTNFKCAFYTYYGQESPQFSNVCVLLTDFQPPHVKCQSCVTSLSDCKHGSNFCNLIDQEDSQQREGMYN